MTVQKSACDLLLERTTNAVWKRGEEYEQTKKVILQGFDERHAIAEAHGSSLYKVQLRFAGGGIGKRCTCPYSEGKTASHAPCKHMVATAILWDEARGIARPSSNNVEEYTIPPPLISREQLRRAYDDPLNADLEVLRLAPDEFALSPRAHARLPNMPEFSDESSDPMEETEVSGAFLAMRSWSRRRMYDTYFCAGEMVAAFCEVMRRIMKRAPATPAIRLAGILLKCQSFHEKLIMELIDDSEGEYVFGNVHLEELHRLLQRRTDVPPDVRGEFQSLLQQYTENLEGTDC